MQNNILDLKMVLAIGKLDRFTKALAEPKIILKHLTSR